jgi:PST family polysaccharide transporter
MNSIWVKYLPPYIRDSLHGRYNLQKLIGNTGWLFADRILRMAVGLVVGVWTARFLGPDQYGLFNFASAFVVLFSILATLGLDGVVVRELVQTPERENEVLGTAFLLKLAGGILTLVIAIAAINLLRPGDSVVHWLVAAIASGRIFQSLDTIDFWFQARVESRFVVYARSCAFLLVSVIQILLIIENAPLIAFASAVSLEMALGAFGLVLVYRSNGQRLSWWTLNVHRITRILKDAWPLALAGMAIMIYMRIDQVMLGQMMGNQAVGVYSAAVRISEAWYFIPLSIVASVTPSLIEAKKVSFNLYYERLARLFRLMVSIALAIAIPITFVSDYVARALYGNRYQGVGPILAIHIWAAVFVFLGVAQGPWNINEGLAKLALLRTFIGAATNVFLNLLLIPQYGPVGAAIATIVSQALSAVVLNALSSKTRKIFKLQLYSMLLFRSLIHERVN